MNILHIIVYRGPLSIGLSCTPLSSSTCHSNVLTSCILLQIPCSPPAAACQQIPDFPLYRTTDMRGLADHSCRPHDMGQGSQQLGRRGFPLPSGLQHQGKSCWQHLLDHHLGLLPVRLLNT